MSNVAIRVKDICKRYRLGSKEKASDTLVEKLGLILLKPILNFKKLWKLSHFKYSEENNDILWALRNISFEVRKGEVLGIIGANGAGKSTLLKILSQITFPTSGKIEINGRIASLLEIGTGFHPELTGRENIYLNGTILGMKKEEIDLNFRDIVEFSGVEKFIDTPIKRYSSGMSVRLAFSVAAHLNPEILLIDEVLAVGDVEFQKKCLGKIDKISRSGRTVIFVSHNMHAIKSLCDKTIVLKDGEIKRIGSTEKSVEYYLSMGNKINNGGEIQWEKESAPGDNRLRLKAVRLISDNITSHNPSVDKDFQIEIDYWNLEANKRRLLSIHLINSSDQMVFSSSNMSSSSSTYDKWCYQEYPLGLFRTKCVIPKNILNPGVHSLNLFINIVGSNDTIIKEKKVITFEVMESLSYRSEFFGEWQGVVRPILAWSTRQIEA